MSTKPQNYTNHGRIPPLGFMLICLVLMVELLARGYEVVMAPSLANGWAVVVITAILGLCYYARVNAQIVQDRVIMLEVRSRLARLLPSEQYADISRLSKSQLIGLRFAGDEELPALMQAALTEKLSNKAIKQRVKDWQADWQRV